MSHPTLSIITVCYQARKALEATMENVLAQTFRSFEYVVVDGASSDGTQKLLEQYENRFSQANISFIYSSEPDKGIYDAMNKGTRLARGEWLLFLNAGDLLSEPEVLKHIFEKPQKAQILYGDTIGIYQGNQKKYPALPLDHLTYEMAFCHQSALVRRELLKASPYDLSYRVCADHKFFLSMYLKGCAFAYLPMTISIYEIAGYSDKNKLLSHREKLRMQKELGIFCITPAWIGREIVFCFKQGIKWLLGQKIIDFVRSRRGEKSH